MPSPGCEVAPGHGASTQPQPPVLDSPLIPPGSLVMLLHHWGPGQGSGAVAWSVPASGCSRASPGSAATAQHAGQGQCSRAKAPELLKCHQGHCYLDVSPW